MRQRGTNENLWKISLSQCNGNIDLARQRFNRVIKLASDMSDEVERLKQVERSVRIPSSETKRKTFQEAQQ
jgi:hypothetical protein